MSDTIQKYKDHVMTGFMKSVVPIVVDKASGATITDIQGREYLDCFAGISVVNAGHGNPQVVAAAKAQMDATPATDIKFCAIDDPSCEACQ